MKKLLGVLLSFLAISSAQAADRNLNYITTASGGVNMLVNNTLVLTLNNSGSATIATNLGVNGALGVTGVLGMNGGATLTGTFAATRALGAAPVGSSQPFVFTTTFSGDAGGTSDVRGLNLSMTASGANSIARASGFNNNVVISASAGTVAAANVINGSMSVTGNAAITNLRMVDLATTFTTGTSIVTSASVYYGKISRGSGTATATTASVFLADDSGGTYATNAFGYDSVSMAGSTLTANFRARNAAGAGRWAYLSDGTALSALAGGLRVGSNVAPVATLDVTGNIAASTTVAAGTTFQSAAPAGASAGLWKLGSLVAGAVVVDTTRSVFIDIGGTVLKFIVAQ